MGFLENINKINDALKKADDTIVKTQTAMNDGILIGQGLAYQTSEQKKKDNESAKEIKRDILRLYKRHRIYKIIMVIITLIILFFF